MGKDIHYSILDFLAKGLKAHNRVKSFEIIKDDDFYIYEIQRTEYEDHIIVVLSDDYYFGDYSKLIVHPILKKGGFILIARPEAVFQDENDSEKKIGIGKIGKLYGALNKKDYWNYIVPPPKPNFNR